MRAANGNQRGVRVLRIVFLIVALAGLGMIAGGIVSIIHKESGMKARATVTECQLTGSRYTTYTCEGTWVEGGSLVDGNGHVVYGVIDDAEPSDIGKTLNVRVSGDEAYTSSLRVPIILLVLGGLLALGSLFISIAAGRQPARPRIPPVLSPQPSSSTTAGDTK
jgi:hypothetical protein